MDQRFGAHVFAGFSLQRRDLTIPEAYCAFPDQFGGCSFQAPDRILERDGDDDLASAYLSATFGKRVTGTLEYNYENHEFDKTQVAPTGLFEDRVRTSRLRPEVRVLFPFGFFAFVGATRFDQLVEQFDDLTSSARSTEDATFWTGDLSIGYRLPERWGSVSLDVRNFTDREYAFFLPALQDQVIPARSAVLRLRLTY
jgi:hypothetical protein